MKKLLNGLLTVALGISLMSQPVSAATNAQFIGDLGRSTSIGNSINNSGVIAGSSPTSAGDYLGFTWNGQITSLGMDGILAGHGSYANDINDTGTIVGSASFQYGNSNAYIKKADRPYQAIPLLPGMINGYATAVNNNDVVVGYNTDYEGNRKAFIFDNGQLSELPSTGANLSEANDINDKNQVVGTIRLNDSAEWAAVLWENSTLVNLGTLSGCSRANAINEYGVIVGDSEICSSTASRPTIWKNGQPTELTLPDEYFLGYANDINDNGDVAGSARLSASLETDGLIWKNNTTLPVKVHNDTAVSYSSANAINNKGEVTGHAYWAYTNGESSWSVNGAYYAFVDVLAPTISITSPITSERLTPRSTVQVEIDATDNVAVTKVEIYLNDSLICTDIAAPYECSYEAPTGSVSHTLKASAFDDAGNSATATSRHSLRNQNR